MNKKKKELLKFNLLFAKQSWIKILLFLESYFSEFHIFRTFRFLYFILDARTNVPYSSPRSRLRYERGTLYLYARIS